MTTIKIFFLQIRALFFQFPKKGKVDITTHPSPLTPWLRACSESYQVLMLKFPAPGASLFPLPSLSNFNLAKWSHFRHRPYHIFYQFPYFVLPIRPQAATSIGYTKPYAKPSQSSLLLTYIQIIILMAQTLYPPISWVWRVASQSKLDNMVNNSSLFSTKYAEFSTNW